MAIGICAAIYLRTNDPAHLGDAALLAAYHEAGHAVTAVVLGYKIESVSLGWSKEGRSHGRLQLTSFPHLPDNFEPGSPLMASCPFCRTLEMIIYFAGGIAERLRSGGPYRQEHYDDVSRAFRLIRGLSPSEPWDVHWNRGELRTEELVRHHWAAIQSLADVLLERQKLNGDEIKALVAPLLGPATWGAICAKAAQREQAGHRPRWVNFAEACLINDRAPNPSNGEEPLP